MLLDLSALLLVSLLFQAPARNPAPVRGGDAAPAPAPVRADAPDRTHRAPADTRADDSRTVAENERIHMERLACIERLQTLAEEQRQTDRIAALDDLLAKERILHERRMAKLRELFGPERFERAEGAVVRRGENDRDREEPKAKRPFRPNATAAGAAGMTGVEPAPAAPPEEETEKRPKRQPRHIAPAPEPMRPAAPSPVRPKAGGR